MRNHLPSRRPHELFAFEHWGQKFHAGIGYAGDSIQEIWLNTGKSGTQAETLARDSAVLISIALQYGVLLSAMRRSIMRDLDGAVSGPIGKLLDMLDEPSASDESETCVSDHSGRLAGS